MKGLRDNRTGVGVVGCITSSRGVIVVVGVAERGVAARDAGAVRGDLASGVTAPDVTALRGTRCCGFGRLLSAC
jgi:hypothetical protein